MTSRQILLIALSAGLPTVAEAQERKSPLADAPAVRQRVELRDKRFEIGAGVSTTLGQDYYHAVLATGRLGFHLTDWLAIAGTAGFNITKDFKTSFHDKLIAVLPEQTGTDRTPTQQDALDGMNKIAQVYTAQAELVPFTGKFSLFSKLFLAYDFYAFGGLGFINFVADRGACTSDGPSCPVVGMKPGANFGLGMHAFVNNFFAVNLEFRDILLRNNPAGRDETGDMIANSEDLRWDSNYIVGLNFMFFLPAKADITP